MNFLRETVRIGAIWHRGRTAVHCNGLDPDEIAQEEIVAEDKKYKFLNPVGQQLPTKTYPLAPRLDKLDGKEIWLSITGEPDITIALERRLKMDYPNVNWRVKKTYGPVQIPLSDEEMKTAQAVVQGVCW